MAKTIRPDGSLDPAADFADDGARRHGARGRLKPTDNLNTGAATGHPPP
jgi:hypothetical protein